MENIPGYEQQLFTSISLTLTVGLPVFLRAVDEHILDPGLEEVPGHHPSLQREGDLLPAERARQVGRAGERPRRLVLEDGEAGAEDGGRGLVLGLVEHDELGGLKNGVKIKGRQRRKKTSIISGETSGHTGTIEKKWPLFISGVFCFQSIVRVRFERPREISFSTHLSLPLQRGGELFGGHSAFGVQNVRSSELEQKIKEL